MAEPTELKRNETYYLRNSVEVAKKKGMSVVLPQNAAITFLKKETVEKGKDLVRNYTFVSPTAGVQIVLDEDSVSAYVVNFLERAESEAK